MTQLSLEIPVITPPVGRMPSEPILRSAEIEDNYRWVARRAWGSGARILWIMLNPSLADGSRDDPTMQRIIGFSYRWGFGALTVCNLYPFISPNTAALRTWRKHWNTTDDWDKAGPYEYDKSAMNAWLHNMDIVRREIKETTVHVAAWGNGADADDLKAFLEEVTWEWDIIGPAKFHATADDGERIPVQWQCLGMTASGAPNHPLARGRHRIPDTAVLQPWKSAA